jgi:hypothetical protein
MAGRGKYFISYKTSSYLILSFGLDHCPQAIVCWNSFICAAKNYLNRIRSSGENE